MVTSFSQTRPISDILRVCIHWDGVLFVSGIWSVGIGAYLSALAETPRASHLGGELPVEAARRLDHASLANGSIHGTKLSAIVVVNYSVS